MKILDFFFGILVVFQDSNARAQNDGNMLNVYLPYHVKSPRNARSPSAMVLVAGSLMILPAALDWAESSAPFGSAARIRIEGFMAFAASATPEIKPPPVV